MTAAGTIVYDGAGRKRTTKPCPGCGRRVSMCRAVRTADPGLAAKPWRIPTHNTLGGDRCRESGLRSA